MLCRDPQLDPARKDSAGDPARVPASHSRQPGEVARVEGDGSWLEHERGMPHTVWLAELCHQPGVAACLIMLDEERHDRLSGTKGGRSVRAKRHHVIVA